MSQEQPPIRSRRELRKARDAQQAAPPADRPPAGPAAGKPEAAGAAESTHTQRSSQIRARDRAALRTIKELEEKEGQLAGGGPPTRRQLRLQQLKEQALTAANPIVAPASGPAARQPAAAGGNASGQRAAGDPPAPQAKAPAAEKKPATGPGAGPQGMTVEQALAARALIAEQAKNQLAKMEHIASLDPEAVDPDILAEQIALAERAAVMNRRAIAKQKLAEQAGTPVDPAAKDATGKAPAAKDRPSPSTADNLAMVTPLEFVKVPGVDRPVMKPPATSHVPVSTRPGSKVKPDAKVQPGAAKRRPASRSNTATPEVAPGRSQVIARAEAAARAATRPKPVVFSENQHEDLIEDLPRVPASSAYGLDPLDAATAGLARAKRNRILQLCVLLFGIVALVSGIFLIVSGISG
ncbi:hypothetical protein FDW83_00200 [Pseudarthrobacter sp. NamE2]|uniref:hypothetical protein n=1 Tax=Pseudarthrobacter sp. NamE2 TaxID=2576838 RepID=UPI0010FD3872|nr:hypothetical protein [Pseudarthrobacter sp. NamE2]TLM86231.1 hypothetical protein FDW83_00200 [Pseudarthrobacter sp. NamE2]